MSVIAFPITEAGTDHMKQEEIPMTKEEFQKLTQDIVMLDGATGSNLMAAGMPERNLYRGMDHGEQGSSCRIFRRHMWKQEARSYTAPTFGGTVTVSDSTACRTSLLK